VKQLTAKGSAKPAGKADSKPVAPAKTVAPKNNGSAKAGAKPAPNAAKPPAPAPAPGPAGSKVVRKGITIVSSKPAKRSTKAPPVKFPILGGPLIKPGAPARKPLIASGPNAPPRTTALSNDSNKPRKTPFDKRQLAKFKAILLRKRAELAGDVGSMETEALMGQSGSLSHLPQHMAEQGSDAYGQSLSLDLAAADRRLIREIDDALARIDAGTYGICEITGKPIKAERLEELPWARYSIEAARELERRTSLS
jgi:RNA polymerase-binding transcription factor